MATAKRKKKPRLDEYGEPLTGRPKVRIDIETFGQLAALQCTTEELACFFSVTKRTMIRRLKEPALREAYERGLALGRVSLRRLQWRHAKMPNSAGVQMTIHLSKHHLGQTEKAALELSGRVDSNVEVNTSARDRVFRKLDTMAERIARRVDGIVAAAGATLAPKQPV
jgi:hypothetical protein